MGKINKENRVEFRSAAYQLESILSSLKDVATANEISTKLKAIKEEIDNDFAEYEEEVKAGFMNNIADGQVYKMFLETDACSYWVYLYVKIVKIRGNNIDFETIKVTKGDYINGVILDTYMTSRKEDFLERTRLAEGASELVSQEEWDKYVKIIESLKNVDQKRTQEVSE